MFASGVLCVLALVVGEPNAVAPFQTMFFLMCYTCVNASCAFLVQVNDPNWRPTFKRYHWAISVVGAVLCVWMMFAMSTMFALVAVLFSSLIFVHTAHTSASSELRRLLPGHEVPARAECADEDGFLLEAEVFLRIDHKLKF